MEQTLLSRMTVDKMATVWEKFGNIFLAGARQRRLRRKDFTILSNNCWGGHVYRHFGLPYLSPTVGLYFYAEEYIRFLQDWKRYIFASLQVIHAKDSRYADDLLRKNQGQVPIGVLGGGGRGSVFTLQDTRRSLGEMEPARGESKCW